METGVAGLLTGALVLDKRNKRLKLFGVPAQHNRNPGITFWKEGLDLCPDVYSKLLIYGKGGTEAEWVTAGFLFEGVIEGFFADGSDVQAPATGRNQAADTGGQHTGSQEQHQLSGHARQSVRDMPREPPRR